MELPVNVSAIEQVDVLSDFLNVSVLDLNQFKIAVSPTSVVIRLKSVPDCKRWIEVDRFLNKDGQASVQFRDDDQPRTSRGLTFSSVKMALLRTKEQMPQAIEMMALYMRQGVGALYKYPEIMTLLKAAIHKNAVKMTNNSVVGAKAPLYQRRITDKKE